MTRLEPAGEPSMEDILASIRKIIAEDPPGSRALPEVRAEPASPSVTDRIFQRLGESARSEPAKPASTNEPYLRSSMPSLSSTPAGSPAAETQKPFDIDAQMAEVLSKTRGMAQRRDVEPKFDTLAPDVQGADVQAALDSLSGAPNFGPHAAPEPRPGFTVARDGFVPETPGKARDSDPFEFSLGPSPFAVRSGQSPAIETAMPEVRDTRFQDFGTFVPARSGIDEAARNESQAAEDSAAKSTVGSDAPVSSQEVPAAAASRTGAAIVAETAAGDVTGSAPTPEAVAAQLKDFEAAINAPAVEPVAAIESVETVLAELKSKLDQAAAPEKNAEAFSGEAEPIADNAPVAAEVPVPEPVAEPLAESPAGFEPEPEPVALAAAGPDAETTGVFDAASSEPPVADIVGIIEPAPIAAPEMPREMHREWARETAQDMVIAGPGNAVAGTYATSPFQNMHVPAMQNSGLPGARSMEDTVAELLRPMLRSWLAENMPKIVERALRKEIDDSLHSEHKTAAE